MTQIITINSRRYDGSVRRSWQCELLHQNDLELLFLGTFDLDVDHSELGRISRGTVSYEYYWLDRWYNVFAFFEPDGAFRNFYCNINMPATLKDSELDYIDLDLDVLVWPDGSIVTLDRDEYEQNAELYTYPIHIRDQAELALDEILRLAEEQKLPFPHRMS